MSTTTLSSPVGAIARDAAPRARADVFGPLLASRRACAVVVGAVSIHLAASRAGVDLVPCPLPALLGIPCPGCGLSRAALALLRGDVVEALRWHAFAPLYVVLAGAIVLALTLPDAARARLAHLATRAERPRLVGPLLVSALLSYWLFRILVLGWTGAAPPAGPWP